MTELLDSPDLASSWCNQQRINGKSIGFVPTMGALHEGHLSLLQQSILQNDLTCLSIFVNPLQFNNPKDLETYPRNMERDIELINKHGGEMVFSGTVDDFFPHQKNHKKLKPTFKAASISGLEAIYRPGHLEGVQVIVERLFETVGPCYAYFGEKDFQQCLLVQEIAAKMDNIHIQVCPTVREPSGLALSSRNQRLSTQGRKLAGNLYLAMVLARNAWCDGERNPRILEQVMENALEVKGVDLEYVAVRSPTNWTANTPTGPLNAAQGLVAVYIEGVRLIDNMALHLRPE